MATIGWRPSLLGWREAIATIGWRPSLLQGGGGEHSLVHLKFTSLVHLYDDDDECYYYYYHYHF